MKKIWVLLVFVLAASWFAAGSSIGADENDNGAPSAEMIIKGDRKSARFSHPVHLDLGISCGQCHHDGDHQPLTAEAIEAMTDKEQLECASCHNQDFANPELQSIKDAFHARCRDCHKQGIEGKTGPTKCNDCHVKQ